MFPSAASRCHTAQPPHNLLSSLPYWFVPLAMITGSKGQDVYGGGSLGLWPTINTLGLWSTSFFLLKTVFYKMITNVKEKIIFIIYIFYLSHTLISWWFFQDDIKIIYNFIIFNLGHFFFLTFSLWNYQLLKTIILSYFFLSVSYQGSTP